MLNLFEKKIPIKIKQKLEYKSGKRETNTILIGAHRMGGIFLESLLKFKKRVLVIDNNPEIIKTLINRKITCVYGDARNKEILDTLNLKKVKTIISTIPQPVENLFLIDYIKNKNPKVSIFVTANHFHEAKKMYKAGADYVILPHLLTGEKVSLMLKKSFETKSYLKKLTKKHRKLLGVDLNLVEDY